MNTDSYLKWCEIDLSKLRSNINAIKNVLPANTKILAVLKDNAYSHGDVVIGQEMLKCGIDYLAVSTIDEAIRLRIHHIECPILILSYTVPSRFHELVHYHLTQTIFSYEYADQLSNYLRACNQQLEVHLMIDTGMHREGILYDESEQELEHIIELYHSDYFRVSGIYTHYAVADSRNIDDMEYTRKQHTLFQSLLKELKKQGISTGFTHTQNTPATLHYPEFQYDYVRIGTLLIGLPYGEVSRLPIANIVSPIFSLKAKVFQVKSLPKNKSISYGNNYTTDSTSIIALVSLGYGDGYPRSLSKHNAKVLIHKQYASVIGDICMDQLIIDVTDIPGVVEGDIVTLIDADQSHTLTTLDHIASSTNCLKHEIMTQIGSRVQCVYIDSTK